MPLGNQTTYKYDELDQLIEVTQLGDINPNGEDEAKQITKYKRNLLGQVTSIEDGLGHIETYNYNPTGQLIEKLTKKTT